MKNTEHDNQNGCDFKGVNRYYDGELEPDEYKRVGEHLKDCESCKTLLKQLQSVSRHFHAEIDASLSRVRFDEVQQRVLEKTVGKRESTFERLKDLLFKRTYTIPAAAAATILLVFMSVTTLWRPASEPSAIVNSFAGQVSSVMIIETPATHHTILWFSEESVANGESSVLQKT